MASARAQAMEQAIRRGAELRNQGADWTPRKRQTYFGEAPRFASGKRKSTSGGGGSNGGGNSGNSGTGNSNSSSSSGNHSSMLAAEVLVLDAIPSSGGYMRIHDDDDDNVHHDTGGNTNENSPAGSRHSSRPGTADDSQRHSSQQGARLGSPSRKASNLSNSNNKRSRPGTPQQVRFGDGSRPGTPLLSEQMNNDNKAGAATAAGTATAATDKPASLLTPDEAQAVAYWHQIFVAAAAEASFFSSSPCVNSHLLIRSTLLVKSWYVFSKVFVNVLKHTHLFALPSYLLRSQLFTTSIINHSIFFFSRLIQHARVVLVPPQSYRIMSYCCATLLCKCLSIYGPHRHKASTRTLLQRQQEQQQTARNKLAEIMETKTRRTIRQKLKKRQGLQVL